VKNFINKPAKSLCMTKKEKSEAQQLILNAINVLQAKIEKLTEKADQIIENVKAL